MRGRCRGVELALGDQACVGTMKPLPSEGTRDMNGKHVAVLMGGWSAEREVSLSSGKACAGARSRSGAIGSRRIDVQPRHRARRLQAQPRPDVVFNALHGRCGEDGTIQGLLEILRHSLHPFRRARLGARHAQGPGQGVMQAAGVPVAGGRRRDRARAAPTPPRCRRPMWSNRSTRAPPSASSSCARTARIRRRSSPARTGPSATKCLSRNYVAGRELTCAVMGDQAARRHRDQARDRRCSTTTTRNTRRAARSTSSRQKLNQIFTNRSKSWR